MGEVLGVAGLVEERAPVVDAADRLDHEHDALRHLDRRAERARRLLLALLDVELDVLLAVEVDAQVGERRLERGQHLVAPGTTSPTPARGRGARRRSAAPRRARRRRARGRACRPRPPTCARCRRGTRGTARPSRRAGSRSARAARGRSVAPSARTASVCTCAASSWSGWRCSSVSALRACSSRLRLSRSGSFAIVGRSIRKGISSPSTVAVSSASTRAVFSSCSRVRAPR